MEVGINSLVGIILGISMFVAGAAIFFNIYSNVVNLPDGVDQLTREQIMNRFDTGSKLYLHDTSLRFDREGKAIFYIGLNNLEDTTRTFNIELQESSEIRSIFLEEITLESKERDVFMIIIMDQGVDRGEQLGLQLDIKMGTEDYASSILYVQN